ncbi:MAG: zinc ribbon domain-containing protein [Planctomycetes bacterium]|nr:zinc ribbon domain-containing protein [Planctomycetota bacterium]
MATISVALLASGDGGVICFIFLAVAAMLAISCRRTDLRCPRCQEVNRPQARFCGQCGHALNRS